MWFIPNIAIACYFNGWWLTSILWSTHISDTPIFMTLCNFMNSIWSSVNRCLGKLCEDVTKLRLIRQNRWMAFWYLLISITFATRKSANIYHISKTLCESAISVTFFNFNHQGPQDAARPGGPWSKSWHRSPRRANICGPRASCARRSRGFCVPQEWDGLGLRNDWNILK